MLNHDNFTPAMESAEPLSTTGCGDRAVKATDSKGIDLEPATSFVVGETGPLENLRNGELKRSFTQRQVHVSQAFYQALRSPPLKSCR